MLVSDKKMHKSEIRKIFRSSSSVSNVDRLCRAHLRLNPHKLEQMVKITFGARVKAKNFKVCGLRTKNNPKIQKHMVSSTIIN